MGVKMGQKWVFRNFLKNWLTDLVPSPREGRYYHSTYTSQVSSTGVFYMVFLVNLVSTLQV